MEHRRDDDFLAQVVGVSDEFAVAFEVCPGLVDWGFIRSHVLAVSREFGVVRKRVDGLLRDVTR